MSDIKRLEKYNKNGISMHKQTFI